MRGEFIGVWAETWREIWLPLVDHEGVPEDVFCELYRALAPLLRDPINDNALALLINDPIQLRAAFEHALFLAGTGVELTEAHDALDRSGTMEAEGTFGRRAAAEAALALMIGDESKASTLLGLTLEKFALDPPRRADAKMRRIDSVINDPRLSKEALEGVQADDLTGERAVAAFLEAAHAVLDDLGGDELSNRYFNLLAGFIEKFSLRYDLRRPCILCPTLAGVFASLMRDLRALGNEDHELDELMKDFEEAVRDLRFGTSSGRIKTCIAKQVMFLEALASMTPTVQAGTLGDMCAEIVSWPHPAVRESLKKLYGFASDRSGIRHGKSRKSSKQESRAMEMRDMVAISILLAGFTPYLSERLDADIVYRGD
jgi:hypothetical protein